jgi:hypothetical protein
VRCASWLDILTVAGVEDQLSAPGHVYLMPLIRMLCNFFVRRVSTSDTVVIFSIRNFSQTPTETCLYRRVLGRRCLETDGGRH